MTLREDAARTHPDFPWLDASDSAGVEALMRELSWLEADDALELCESAGPGNMNLTLHVRSPRRDCVLKQARPWVEKFDHIPAPWNRANSEIAFYESVAAIPEVRSRMPRLLGSDAASRTLLLEYLPGDGDFSDLYAGVPPDKAATIEPSELSSAAHFLAHLHHHTSIAREDHAAAAIANREMRVLNFTHIFEVPFAEDSGAALNELGPGLAAVASSLRLDSPYRARVAETGEEYLRDGSCLLHGDYFPGSWLRSREGLRVIDPEFCFHGAPEIDLGCAIAHFALARLPAEIAHAFVGAYRATGIGLSLRQEWVARFAGVETMRRLIGVAQLPLTAETDENLGAIGFRAALLARSREAMMAGDYARLWSNG